MGLKKGFLMWGTVIPEGTGLSLGRSTASRRERQKGIAAGYQTDVYFVRKRRRESL